MRLYTHSFCAWRISTVSHNIESVRVSQRAHMKRKTRLHPDFVRVVFSSHIVYNRVGIVSLLRRCGLEYTNDRTVQLWSGGATPPGGATRRQLLSTQDPLTHHACMWTHACGTQAQANTTLCSEFGIRNGGFTDCVIVTMSLVADLSHTPLFSLFPLFTLFSFFPFFLFSCFPFFQFFLFFLFFFSFFLFFLFSFFSFRACVWTHACGTQAQLNTALCS